LTAFGANGQRRLALSARGAYVLTAIGAYSTVRHLEIMAAKALTVVHPSRITTSRLFHSPACSFYPCILWPCWSTLGHMMPKPPCYDLGRPGRRHRGQPGDSVPTPTPRKILSGLVVRRSQPSKRPPTRGLADDCRPYGL